MKDDFLVGFTFASIIYFLTHYFILDSYTVVPLKKIVLACNDKGYFISEGQIIICKSYSFINNSSR